MAMMQSGIGFSKIIILAGAGYTSTILLQNGKLSDVLGELQALIKGLESSGDKSNSDPEYADAIAAQVKRLAMEVRQLATARPITVLNGGSGQFGNVSSMVVPAAALGAVGYGYMWWKGIKFSDLMYVTKSGMASAVSSLTKHLEHVQDKLAEAKKHLTQRINSLDGKLDEQKEVSRLIKSEVTNVHEELSEIGCTVGALRDMITGLDGRIDTLQSKQEFANRGVKYLCDFVSGKPGEMPEILQDKLEFSGRSSIYLASSEKPSLMGLKEIADSLVSGNSKRLLTDSSMQDNIVKLDDQPRSLMRTASTKC